MKKILMAAAIAATMALTACSGKSEASREQISNGHEQAKEMLRKTAAQPSAGSAIVASADSVR